MPSDLRKAHEKPLHVQRQQDTIRAKAGRAVARIQSGILGHEPSAITGDSYDSKHPSAPRSGRTLIAPQTFLDAGRWVKESVTTYGLASFGLFWLADASLSEAEHDSAKWVLANVFLGAGMVGVAAYFIVQPYDSTNRNARHAAHLGLSAPPSGPDVFAESRENLRSADKNDVETCEAAAAVAANLIFGSILNQDPVSISVAAGCTLASALLAAVDRSAIAREFEKASVPSLLQSDPAKAEEVMKEICEQHTMNRSVGLGMAAGFAPFAASTLHKGLTSASEADFAADLSGSVAAAAGNLFALAGALVLFARSYREQAVHIARVEADDIKRFRLTHSQTLDGDPSELQGLATVTGRPIRVFEQGVADFPARYEPQEDKGVLLPATSEGHELKVLGKAPALPPPDPDNTVYLYKTDGGYRTIDRAYVEALIARHKGDDEKFFSALDRHFAKAVDGEVHSDIGARKIEQLTDGNFARSAFECLATTEKQSLIEWLHPTRRRIAARLRAEVASQLKFDAEDTGSVYLSAQSSNGQAPSLAADSVAPLRDGARSYLTDVIGKPGAYVGEPACFLAAHILDRRVVVWQQSGGVIKTTTSILGKEENEPLHLLYDPSSQHYRPIVALPEGIDVVAGTSVKLDDTVKIEPAIGRGDCFFHSVARLSNPAYAAANVDEKTKIAHDMRDAFQVMGLRGVEGLDVGQDAELWRRFINIASACLNPE